MKLRLSSLLVAMVVALLLLPAGGCRSGKEAVQSIAEAESGRWENVTMPVKVSVIKPRKISLSGTATMVNGEYIFISLRFLGFEVMQLNLTPDRADLVVKKMTKMWVQTPLNEHLRAAGLTLANLQETLMGSRSFADRLPESLRVEFGGTEQKPEVTLTGSVKGREVEATLTLNLASAKWNSDSPRRLIEPGADYRKTSVAEVIEMLKKI